MTEMLLLLLLLCVAAIGAGALCRPGQVMELEDSNFDAAISECRYVLVDFYAPWCWHCKALSPQLDELAIRLESVLPQLKLAKINADKYSSINSKYKISEYPTLKLFIDGAHSDYTGPHQHAETMLDHLKKLMSPDLSVLPSPASVPEFVNQAGSKFPIFIAFGLEGSTLAQLAKEHKTRAWFAVVTMEEQDLDSAAVMAEFGLDDLPALLVQHSQQQEQQAFYGLFHGDALAGFVKHNLLPAVTDLAQDNLNLIKADGRPILLAIVNKSDSAPPGMKALASSHREFVFATLNASRLPALADSFHGFKLLIWSGQSDFYTTSSSGKQEELDEITDTDVLNLVEEFKEKKAKKNVTKQPSFMQQMLSFVGQNLMYILLFAVTIVVFLQGMDWAPNPQR